jgi:hypothetical protein
MKVRSSAVAPTRTTRNTPRTNTASTFAGVVRARPREHRIAAPTVRRFTASALTGRSRQPQGLRYARLPPTVSSVHSPRPHPPQMGRPRAMNGSPNGAADVVRPAGAGCAVRVRPRRRGVAAVAGTERTGAGALGVA